MRSTHDRKQPQAVEIRHGLGKAQPQLLEQRSLREVHLENRVHDPQGIVLVHNHRHRQRYGIRRLRIPAITEQKGISLEVATT